jgi:hypothetical protein
MSVSAARIADRNEKGEKKSTMNPKPTPQPRPLTSRNRTIALTIALVADAAQWLWLPMVIGGALSPINNLIDVIVALVMIRLVGFHWAFLPAFIAEMVPFFDLVPTWTFAVWLATRGRVEPEEPPTPRPSLPPST